MAPKSTQLSLTSTALLVTCFLFLFSCPSRVSCDIYDEARPNILFIMLSELGWNDLGVRDPNMFTPTLDRLYEEGIRLESSYVDPEGSSTRAAFFSGNFSFTMGLQDGAIHKYSRAHVPLNHKLLPKALEDQGYYTHLVGKWNQGFCNEAYTPTERGFQSFFGQYTESTDHYTLRTEEGFYDLHEGNVVDPDKSHEGLYSTELWAKRAVKMIKRHENRYPVNNAHPFFLMLSLTGISAPNDVSDKYLRKCRKGVFTSEARRVKCGMMAAVDIAVQRVLKALEETGQQDNTLVVFTSDAGGRTDQGSSNWPLRGSGGTVWEGGIRVPSFIWSASKDLLPKQNVTFKGAFHAVDWYPTLMGFALKNMQPELPLKIAPYMDGRNFYRSFKKGVRKSFRTQFAYLVNETRKKYNVAVVRDGDFKLVADEKDFIGWYAPPPEFNSTIEEPRVNYRRKPFLMFNIKKDPKEKRDLSRSKVPRNAEYRERLVALWDEYKLRYAAKQKRKANSSPENHPEHNGVWSTGTC